MINMTVVGGISCVLFISDPKNLIHMHAEREIVRLAKQLGSDDFSEREQASTKLTQFGALAIPTLRHLIDDPDPEIAWRARCLSVEMTARMRDGAVRLLSTEPVLIIGVPTSDSIIIQSASSNAIDSISFLEANPSCSVIESLQWIHELQHLHLTHSSVSDAEVAFLRGPRGLWLLDLGGSSVTDDGLRSLNCFRHLYALDLSRSRVTGKGLPHLCELSHLCMLNLRGTKIGDSEMKHLQIFKALHTLDLRNTIISDDGLIPLQQLNGLKSLRLEGTRVSEKGIEALQTALPTVVISR